MFKIEGDQITIDLGEALQSLPDSVCQQLADAIAVRDSVIKYVVQQILDGWTDHGSRAGRSLSGDYPDGLDWAIREVAKRAGEVAKEEIERLENMLNVEKEHVADLRAELNHCSRGGRGGWS